MTNETIRAIETVQMVCSKRSDVSYRTARWERTLDDLVANPDRTGDPKNLINNAYGNAGKVERRRSKKLFQSKHRDVAEHLDYDPRHAHDHSDEVAVMTIRDFIKRAKLDERDRTIITMLADGHRPAAVARHLGVSLNYAWVLISRARAKAKAQWEVA